MGIVDSVLFVLCLTATAYYGYCMYAARDFFSRRKQPGSIVPPPISVLKPLRGLDYEAYQNLASFCRQDYPNYQIVLGVRDPDDPALEVARRLVANFPRADITLVVGGSSAAANPKVANLTNMVAAAKHGVLLVSDSDIRVDRDHLRSMAASLEDPHVGVVTCMYRARGRGIAAHIQAVASCTEFQPGVLAARKLEGIKFAMGAGILIRRSVLDEIGGFAAIADYISDDYLLGKLPARLGYRVALSPHVVDHVVGGKTMRELVEHQVRWNRSIRASRPWAYRGLIFTQGTASSLALVAATHGSPLGLTVGTLTITARLSMAWVVGAKYLHAPGPKRSLSLVIPQDLLSSALWWVGCFGGRVTWRGAHFRVTKEGKLVPLDVDRGVAITGADGADGSASDVPPTGGAPLRPINTGVMTLEPHQRRLDAD